MRPLAKILTALGFIWTGAVSAFLLAGSRGRVRTAFNLSEGAGETAASSVALMSPSGVWLVALLLGVTVFAGIPFGVAIYHPTGHRLATWTVGLLLLALSAMTASSIGPFYVPGVLVLLGGAHVSGNTRDIFVARSHPRT